MRFLQVGKMMRSKARLFGERIERGKNGFELGREIRRALKRLGECKTLLVHALR